MKLTTNNKRRVYGFIFLGIGLILFVLSIVFLTKNMSFSGSYFDPDSMEYAENDYEEAFLGAGNLFTTLLIFSIIMISFSLYILFSYELNKKYLLIFESVLFALIGFEGMSYPMVYADKVLSRTGKAISKLESLDLVKSLGYLEEVKGYPNPIYYILFGIIGIFGLGFCISKIIQLKKEEK